MKDDVLHGLLVARTLFDTARRYCFVRDKFVASAGLVALQDAVELVFYCCLLELGVDEEKAIDRFNFDKLMDEFKPKGLKIKRSGKLKTMNEARNHIKHRAELAEPAAVRQFFEASVLATDALLQDVVGKPLRLVVIADAIDAPELRAHIADAVTAMEAQRYDEAMLATRKALYRAIEADYDIRRWTDHDGDAFGLRELLLYGSSKAPFNRCNREWIQQNVKDPTDYIQLDNKQVEAEMWAIGVDPEEFRNVCRLTPAVYHDDIHGWATRYEPGVEDAANEHNAHYCLDVVVSILRNQQLRKAIIRSRPDTELAARMRRDQALLTHAKRESAAEGTLLREGKVYNAGARVVGLDGDGEYVWIWHLDAEHEPSRYFGGYIPLDACDLEKMPPGWWLNSDQ